MDLSRSVDTLGNETPRIGTQWDHGLREPQIRLDIEGEGAGGESAGSEGAAQYGAGKETSFQGPSSMMAIASTTASIAGIVVVVVNAVFVAVDVVAGFGMLERVI